MTTSPPTLSWIFPLYRTAAQLDELLARVEATSTAMEVSYEVVLVDDACPEGSGEAAERAAAQIERLRVVRLASNSGQDGALRAGLQACRGSWAVILDADLQDPPEGAAALWTLHQDGWDAIFAQRSGIYTTAGRHLTSHLYRRLVSAVAGLPAGACLFVLLNRRLIDHIAASSSPRPSILAVIAASRASCTSVPVARVQRAQGRSAYTSLRRLDKGLGSLWQMILHRFLGAPLQQGKQR
jgi:glycosyltransferase involved in cell wall biosynthesis